MHSSNFFTPLSALLQLAIPLAILGCAGSQAAPPDPVANEQLVRRYFEDMWNRMDPSVAGQIVDEDVIGHVGATTLHKLEALKERVAAVGRIYERSTFSIESLVADGELVAVRWTQRARHSGAFLGPKTQGKDVTVGGMSLFRLSGGKIVEIWVNADDLGELQQLGVAVPSGV